MVFRFFILAFTLLLAQVAEAQTFYARGKMVLSSTSAFFKSVNPTPADEWYHSQFPRYFNKPSLGWNLGFGVEYLDKKWFSLCSEAGFVQNGSQGTEDYQFGGGGLVSEDLETRFQFITLNTLAFAKLVDQELVTLQFGLGMQVNFLTNYQLPPLQNGFYDVYPIEEYFSPVSGDLLGHLRLTIKLKQFRLGMNLGYNLSAIHVLDARVQSEFEFLSDVDMQMRINYFSSNLLLGYQLKGKRKE